MVQLGKSINPLILKKLFFNHFNIESIVTRRPAFAILILLLALWHSWPFLAGYRLTADDVHYTYLALQGPSVVFSAAQNWAEETGRIGFLLVQTVNMFSALKSEFLVWRILFVGLYMLTAWLAFVYAAQLLEFNIAPLAFLIFLAIHPLAFDHLPPTSFPMQNTWPFLLLFAGRLAGLGLHERGGWMVLLHSLQVVAMLATEYAMVLGVVMISAEAITRHPVTLRNFAGWLRGVLSDTAVRGDVAKLFLVLGIYGGYRLAFPSTYAGNTAGGIENIGAIAYTTWRHIVDGLVLPRLHFDVLRAPQTIWMANVLAGLFMYAAMRIAFQRTIAMTKPLGPLMLFLVGAMVLVTIPVSSTQKYQDWCTGSQSCAYIDSRTSILGLALVFALLTAKLLHQWQGGKLRSNLHRLLAGLTAVLFVFTGLHNWSVAERMRRSAQVWESAQTLACVPTLVPAEPVQLSSLIDPDRLTSYHTYETAFVLWPLYLEAVRARGDCEGTDVINRRLDRSYLPLIFPDQPQAIRTDSGGKYLGKGWSGLEPWGVWSVGNEAQLLISPVGLEHGEMAILQLDATMLLDNANSTQRLVVTQRGQTIWEGTRTQENQDDPILVPLLPHDTTQETLILTFKLPDAHQPRNSRDKRQLGIGLHSIKMLVSP